MMKLRKLSQRLTAVAVATVLTLSMFATTAFAAETTSDSKLSEEANTTSASDVSLLSVGTYGPGDWDLGGGTFYNSNLGNARTYNAHYMQIKPAWKASDSSTSEVELLVKVIRQWNGDVAYEHRFKLYEDTDGRKDGDGWWYAESAWFPINYGSDYQIYYEAFTADGYQGIGTNRSAHFHTWIELKN